MSIPSICSILIIRALVCGPHQYVLQSGPVLGSYARIQARAIGALGRRHGMGMGRREWMGLQIGGEDDRIAWDRVKVVSSVFPASHLPFIQARGKRTIKMCHFPSRLERKLIFL